MSRSLRVHKRNESKLNQEVNELKVELEKQTSIFNKKIKSKNDKIAQLELQVLSLQEDNVRLDKEVEEKDRLRRLHYQNHRQAVAQREVMNARLYDAKIRRYLRGLCGFEHKLPQGPELLRILETHLFQ